MSDEMNVSEWISEQNVGVDGVGLWQTRGDILKGPAQNVTFTLQFLELIIPLLCPIVIYLFQFNSIYQSYYHYI